MAAWLEVVEGRSSGRRFPISAAEATLGRDEGCEVSLLDEAASRRHAAISRRGDRYFVRDLGSRNGTRLNGLALPREEPIRSGDEVTIGATRLRFVDESERTRDTAPLLPPGATAAAPVAPAPPREEFRVEKSLRIEAADAAAPTAGPAPAAAEVRLRCLLALGRLIASAEQPATLLAAALRTIRDPLRADRAAAALVEASGLDLAGAVVEPPGELPSRALLDRALRGDEALLVSADPADPRADRSLLGRESVARQGVRAVLATPILVAGARRGVLYVDRLRSGGRFEEEDLAFLAEVARQLGAALAALSRTGEAREESEAWRRLATRPARSRPDAALVVGEAPAFRAALDVAERVARSEAAVLILGETGTGKEVFARFVHDRSSRAQGPFVAVNCAAVPESLLESELFGHEKGAFTGADKRRRGLFELARGGTLFMDEVGEMPLSLQAKLLRVLETREVRRLGAEAEVKVDLRLVAATNRDLEREVRARSGSPAPPPTAADASRPAFREDLFYRLAVFTIRLPPLRERPGDAERLARHFLSELAPRAGKPGLRLTDLAVAGIKSKRWAGNVRELRNAVERAVALVEGTDIGPDLLDCGGSPQKPGGEEHPTQPTNVPLVQSIADAEKQAIIAALHHTGGKKGEAARILGIAHPTLNRKLKEYGLNETFDGD